VTLLVWVARNYVSSTLKTMYPVLLKPGSEVPRTTETMYHVPKARNNVPCSCTLKTMHFHQRFDKKKWNNSGNSEMVSGHETKQVSHSLSVSLPLYQYHSHSESKLNSNKTNSPSQTRAHLQSHSRERLNFTNYIKLFTYDNNIK